MKAIDNLNQAVTNLTAAVDAAVNASVTPDAQVQAASDAVAAQTSRLTAVFPLPAPAPAPATTTSPSLVITPPTVG